MHKLVSVSSNGSHMPLNEDLLSHILTFLSKDDLCAMRCVNKSNKNSVNGFFKLFRDKHTSFNNDFNVALNGAFNGAISTTSLRDLIPIMQRLDLFRRQFGSGIRFPVRVPSLPVGLLLHPKELVGWISDKNVPRSSSKCNTWGF